ncbi:MAG TPA: mercuric reductase [Cyanobacteria bacterium UBA11149]|nr:mercuric reductase [Cyanobacteria bacterium UBA11367]HBE60217.1 mercuric reductase [Cyanobacteria bacterium UBA11366]HBK62394.1 mercuric reductase [Cyanobacteria bacterium UBA11166]HBR74162.1 mercuric reductase [Cyanobacteria bacterium UBA11159]HBS70617.1 mercuric reductase [Cyanobacteria bacterium UBA11153]HBW87721.1 mercuric reductase [Cyanobacteria bacterium UBA11149]HCA96577.1 mercuric reductase [Cyanobacteria bacterium UBA9226]
MTVEYDLIIIGGSKAGIYAALTSAYLKARVALVISPNIYQKSLENCLIYNQTFTEISQILSQVRNAPQFGIEFPIIDTNQEEKIPSVKVSDAMDWAEAVVDNCGEEFSPVMLASVGVDVINGDGEFYRLPHFGFIVNNRRLRSRSFLIATGNRPKIPDINGLSTVDYCTPMDIWRQLGKDHTGSINISDNIELPNRWVVIGGSYLGIELAQTLARLDCQVTLVISEAHILPESDLEASNLIQGELEAEGIKIFTKSPVTQIREIEGKKWIQAGNRAIEADNILLAMGEEPNIEGLNWEGVGVKFDLAGLVLNEKLQTTNPRIYACGSVAGGLAAANLARYQARIAVKNALFAPLFQVNYLGIPQIIFTQPQLAEVGLTEETARERYGKDIWVVRQYFKNLDKGHILGETTGFCKFVVRRNGEILGASIVGVEASELIGAIALSIQHKIKLGDIADLAQVSPSCAEILEKTAQQWQDQRLQSNKTLQNFLESFFNWRRDWSK